MPTPIRPTPIRKALLIRALAVAARVHWPLLAGPAALAGALVSFAPIKPVRQWQLNVQALTGQLPGRRATALSVYRWAENTVVSLQLSTWSAAKIDRRVQFSPEHRSALKRAAVGPGVLIALPHMGSWDLAGAWGCIQGLPVTSVAEQLPPKEFAMYTAARQRLGFEVFGYREPGLLARLAESTREGRMVCLLCDRDFGRRGVRITWPAPDPIEATMPAGPAEIALRTGATLFGAAPHMQAGRMRIVLREVSAPVDPASDQAHQAALEDMTQQLCDFFASEISAHPTDWHLFQPIFPGVRA